MNRKTFTSTDTIVVCLVYFQILLFLKLSTLSLDRLTVNRSESPFVDDIFGGGRFRRSHTLSFFCIVLSISSYYFDGIKLTCYTIPGDNFNLLLSLVSATVLAVLLFHGPAGGYEQTATITNCAEDTTLFRTI